MKKIIRQRLDEIYFIRYIDRIRQASKEPTKIYDLIEMLCTMTGVDFLPVAGAAARVLAEEKSLFPSRYEMYQLLSRTEKPVIEICRELQMSMREYYAKDTFFQAPMNTAPRFNKEQTEAVGKFLDAIEDLFLERRDYTYESTV